MDASGKPQTSAQAGRVQVQQTYAPLLECAGDSLVLAVVDAGVGDDARGAIAKSLVALGWDEGDLTFATADSPALPLDASALFTLVEGLDPIACVVAGSAAHTLFAQAYRTELPSCGTARAFCRTVAAFDNLDALMQTSTGKQRAWSVLKQLPHR